MKLKPIDWRDLAPGASHATMGMGYVAMITGEGSRWDWIVYASGFKAMYGTQPSLKRAKESCEDVFFGRVHEIVECEPFCEYCYKCKPIPTTDFTTATVFGKPFNSIDVDYPLEFGTATLSVFIKYCPMCGRDLNLETVNEDKENYLGKES
jgi:hypothetical protein